MDSLTNGLVINTLIGAMAIANLNITGKGKVVSILLLGLVFIISFNSRRG